MKGFPSNRHSKLATPTSSFPVNKNVMDVRLVEPPSGTLRKTMMVFGGVVSAGFSRACEETWRVGGLVDSARDSSGSIDRRRMSITAGIKRINSDMENSLSLVPPQCNVCEQNSSRRIN